MKNHFTYSPNPHRGKVSKLPPQAIGVILPKIHSPIPPKGGNGEWGVNLGSLGRKPQPLLIPFRLTPQTPQNE